MLTIPIKHVGGSQGRQLYRDVKLDNTYPWQRLHWRTLQTAYRSSPFFEFYEEELEPLFTKKNDFLLDFNLKTIETICECLQIPMPKERTEQFEVSTDILIDARYLVNAKKDYPFDQQSYQQVFQDRHGFIKNLSILDLLFNEGNASTSYLEELRIDLKNA